MKTSMILVLTVLGCLAHGARCKAQSIDGKVLDEEGLAIDNAFVIVWSAGPRSGKGTLCPSCYPGVGEFARTDNLGDFQVGRADAAMAYRVLVTRPGFRPAVSKWIYPPKPITIALASRPKDIPAVRLLRGRMIDSKGNPIAGAEIEPFGLAREDGTGTMGSMDGHWDQLVISGDDGRFEVIVDEPAATMQLRVRASGFAPRLVKGVSLGGETHEIALNRGSSVIGRIVATDFGTVVADRQVGICTVSRLMDDATGWASVDQKTVSEADGSFRFDNLPISTEFFVYSLTDDRRTGAFELTAFRSEVIEREKDLGTLPLRQTFRLSGHVVMPNGAAMPRQTRMIVSRTQAWDSHEFVLDDTGKFDVSGVPAEAISLTVRVPGYRCDTNRVNFQLTGSYEMTMPVAGDLPDIEIFLVEE